MHYYPLTDEQRAWKDRAADVAAREIGPRAAEVDRTRTYPAESLAALQREGFWGLRASKEHGGAGADLLSTCLVVEEIAKKCPSTSMCYKMHLEASEVLARVASPAQVERLVKPLGAGKVFATVAGSESWTDGDNWTSSRAMSSIAKVDGGYRVENLRKSYVTSAGHATHFFFIARAGHDTTQDQVSVFFVGRDELQCEILEEWTGLGLRGNESCPVRFNGFIPEDDRIGAEHTVMREVGGLFQPVLGCTYAASYLGMGTGALEVAIAEGTRAYADGSRRIDGPVNQRRIADMHTRLAAAQTVLHAAADAFDQKRAIGPAAVMQAKLLCSEAAVSVTQDLMTMFGGTAFAARLPFERYFRDARAGIVMALANDSVYATIAQMVLPREPRKE
jgi:alkylation response protein AidB-like acyl-CoA dehydrogenase